MNLRAKNWREFQHYSNRRPTWIKLHRKLLDDRAYLRLPDASKALAPLLWLLCSETDDGVIRDAITEIAFRLRMSEQQASKSLAPLLAAGFFIEEQDASDALAGREQFGVSEKRREREEQRRVEKNPSVFVKSPLVAVSDKHTGATRAKPIPPDWQPTPDDIAALRKARPDLVGAWYDEQMDRFRDWCRSQAVTSHDFASTWRGYMRKAAEAPPKKTVGWN